MSRSPPHPLPSPDRRSPATRFQPPVPRPLTLFVSPHPKAPPCVPPCPLYSRRCLGDVSTGNFGNTSTAGRPRPGNSRTCTKESHGLHLPKLQRLLFCPSNGWILSILWPVGRPHPLLVPPCARRRILPRWHHQAHRALLTQRTVHPTPRGDPNAVPGTLHPLLVSNHHQLPQHVLTGSLKTKCPIGLPVTYLRHVRKRPQRIHLPPRIQNIRTRGPLLCASRV
jgi:hypothetical protein